MSNKSGAIGTRTETAVVHVLQSHGWPHAERRRLRGRLDPGDITGTPGLAWSVKGGQAARTASDLQVAAWLDRTEEIRANVGAYHGVLVLARRGVGYDNAHRWWAFLPVRDLAHLTGSDPRLNLPVGHIQMRLDIACDLLNGAGYGTPRQQEATA